MTPEAARYLDKADRCLSNAKTSLNVNLTNDAGRSAHLAAFHSAPAFIFERTGKIAKSHTGVHTEFARLLEDTAEISKDVTPFLQRPYNRKVLGLARGSAPPHPPRSTPYRSRSGRQSSP
jgi:uncharacterized protein (UPF0332 family)